MSGPLCRSSLAGTADLRVQRNRIDSAISTANSGEPEGHVASLQLLISEALAACRIDPLRTIFSNRKPERQFGTQSFRNINCIPFAGLPENVTRASGASFRATMTSSEGFMRRKSKPAKSFEDAHLITKRRPAAAGCRLLDFRRAVFVIRGERVVEIVEDRTTCK